MEKKPIDLLIIVFNFRCKQYRLIEVDEFKFDYFRFK